MKIFVVEDDKEVLEYIVNNFTESQYTVEFATDGEIALQMALANQYDAIIVDRMLPKLDGLTIIERLRASGNFVPILILSTLGDVDDRVKGLRSGGDDYLVKPFSFIELLARIESLHRRNITKNNDKPTKLSADNLEMDLLERIVIRAGEQIELQAREFKLLEYLLKNKGQVVTKTMLLENVWEYNFDPQTNVIEVHVSRLRAKIDNGFEKQILKTVRGVGFIIE